MPADFFSRRYIDIHKDTLDEDEEEEGSLESAMYTRVLAIQLAGRKWKKLEQRMAPRA